MLFSTLKKYWKVPLHLLVKWEVVSPNSREGQLESISIISSIPLLWFCISNVGWFGGGGCNVFLTFYAISNISRKKNLGIQNNYFSFNVFFMFFFVCWKYSKVPLHLQLLVKWEVVSPNSRYREFYHEIGNIEKFPFTLLVKWEVVSPNRTYTCREFEHEVNWKVDSPDSR